MTTTATPAVLPDSRTHVVYSSIVGENYQLSVWMPPSYTASVARFPVLYVLDAAMTFAFAAQATMINVFGGVVPEVLVVGIGRPVISAYEDGPSRARDYSPVPIPGDQESGHADAFIEALRTELLPFTDHHYRTDRDDRSLWGHSLGGAFALFTLSHESRLFHRIIATSPSIIEQGQPLLTNWPTTGAALEARVFTSIGADDVGYRPHLDAFNDEIAAGRHPEFRYEWSSLDTAISTRQRQDSSQGYGRSMQVERAISSCTTAQQPTRLRTFLLRRKRNGARDEWLRPGSPILMWPWSGGAGRWVLSWSLGGLLGGAIVLSCDQEIE